MGPAAAHRYIAVWASACLVALVVAAVRGRSFAIARRAYWVGLARPWKLATFAVAFAGIVLVAPRSGDPTWDHVDAAFMALLSFTTAPWSLGVLVRAARRASKASEIYVAACTWLFSASFSYDLYLFLRDGVYPATWWANLFASTGLYFCAGAMWSLRSGDPMFAFLRADWPASLTDGSLRAIVPRAGFFMLCVLAMLAPFLWYAFHR
ncbi:MAG TPA: hypothetical protein VGH28_06900 [Polyangiaceae bacterium]|jgi:hypothetical protein